MIKLSKTYLQNQILLELQLKIIITNLQTSAMFTVTKLLHWVDFRGHVYYKLMDMMLIAYGHSHV